MQERRSWQPLHLALVLAFGAALLAYFAESDLRILFLGIAIAISGLQLWEEQRVGFFSREDDPYIFWSAIVLVCGMAFLSAGLYASKMGLFP